MLRAAIKGLGLAATMALLPGTAGGATITTTQPCYQVEFPVDIALAGFAPGATVGVSAGGYLPTRLAVDDGGSFLGLYTGGTDRGYANDTDVFAHYPKQVTVTAVDEDTGESAATTITVGAFAFNRPRVRWNALVRLRFKGLFPTSLPTGVLYLRYFREAPGPVRFAGSVRLGTPHGPCHDLDARIRGLPARCPAPGTYHLFFVGGPGRAYPKRWVEEWGLKVPAGRRC